VDIARIKKERRKKSRRSLPVPFSQKPKITLHPLFIAVGVWHCFDGGLFLFLMSCIVALQHEYAHAYIAEKLGYTLHKIVLMPYGAVLDGDLQSLSVKDEILVALAGPLCNLATAVFFAALWWFAPTMYAFTDTACQISLSIALVNLLPAYPLDGGRVLHCLLVRAYLKKSPNEGQAEQRARTLCRGLSLSLALVLLTLFIVFACTGKWQMYLGVFALFLLLGALGNKAGDAVYAKIDVSKKQEMQRGIEIKRVAVLQTCTIKDTLRFVGKNSYLVLEVYDEQENKLFTLPQNRLAAYILRAPTPYTTLQALYTEEAENKANKKTQ
jgi:stage IV sporulation protein FB